MFIVDFFRTSTDSARNDVEMQANTVGQHNIEQLATFFRLPSDQLKSWPGISAWQLHLEESFRPLLREEYNTLWSAIACKRPHSAEECWSFLNAVVDSLHHLWDTDASIEELWEGMVERAAHTADGRLCSPSRIPPVSCSMAIFAALCWSTMVLQPVLVPSDDRDYPSFRVEQTRCGSPGLKIDFAQRPIRVLSQNLQRTMKTTSCRIDAVQSGDSTSLRVASLDYASLRTIAKVSMVWVDDLSSHLDFDAASRTLSVFRFPSFCALMTIADGQSRPSLQTGYDI